jgi:AAA domain
VPWFTKVDDFLQEKIPPKRLLITDMAGNPILTSSMLAELYAFRGIGKSLFLLAFIRLLIFGGEFLGYKSTGGFKVLLCDGELPPQDLQDRLKELVGISHGLFDMMDTSHLPGNIFPAMSDPDYQKEFIRQVDELKPDVIIFDTLTACFRFDTNDPDMWTLVNQFFIDLRNKEYCMGVAHHAGKNNTQRGRTDAEDNMDVVLKLDMPAGHEPGMGLEFVVTYEKYRAKVKEGTKILGFQAKLVLGKWELVIDSERQGIIDALLDGQSWRWIKDNIPGVNGTKINNTKIHNAVDFMKGTGMTIPPPKSKTKKVKKDGGK